ncbi:DUF5302 domain-containing protein [Streptomyces sp. ZAF1911]|uniref:DUF5302 domain-containing protein n=1 Tax=Streptomyces TaxID=1883 RepID=UPI001FAEF874|nr:MULTISPECIES: DUF5302 domain-containing protein [unclassified Streptomyces]MCJ0869883.1 DUF5302 domain-containing protein [Streptomyces sp. AP-93]MCM1969627.1 DUF5302 domain-containing protein [Streptomyces sp. G1]MCX4775774.1 DUF5302 domain-containing protein [Streptomyces sp. NBC_01264]MCX5128548.1 DUF5302 domain-containing protein [Streptomyces sp. NBC_00347]MCX5409455.1 DUF5302 domain-containing protein [Streptomyces sp. NBC_00086]
MSEESDTPQNESPAEEAKRKFKEALERNAANAQSQQAHQSRAKIQGAGGNPGGKNKKVRRKTG